MKKIILLLSIFMISINVYACGEIKSIKVENAIVKETSGTSYLVRLNEPKDRVMLEVSSDYDFVSSYGSRVVDTSKDALVKVNGYKCGFGIYTYTVSFEVSSKTIAENTADDNNTNDEDTVVLPKLGLKSILISGYSFEFSPTKYSYILEVPASVTSLDITTTKINDSDTVTISDNANKLDSDPIIITVSNDNGRIVYYGITIKKAEKQSDNNFLASLRVTGYILNFDPNITEYTLSIPNNVDAVEVIAVTEAENAKAIVTGNNFLENGSIINITVIAEDKTKKEYTIKIVKTYDILNIINEYKMYIIISLLIILLFLLIIISRKKRKKKNSVKPASIDTPITTAGEVKEYAPPVELQEETSVTTEPAKLNIIIPSDIETSNVETDLNDTTEIFRL